MLAGALGAISDPAHPGRTIADSWNGDLSVLGSGSDYTAYLDHLGIGGCLNLGNVPGNDVFWDDETAGTDETAGVVLRDLPRLLPSLTALNAHRLPGRVTVHDVQALLDGLPRLVSLDLSGTESLEEAVEHGLHLEHFPMQRWRSLGRADVGFEHFVGGGTAFIAFEGDGCVVVREADAQ